MSRRILPFVLLALAAPLAAGEWPLHRGNAAQTGTSSEMLPEKLAVLWEYKAGRSVEGGAVIADGVVFIASTDKFLHAIHLKNGQTKWKTPIGPTTAAPGINGDRVYIGDDDGKFHCLKRATGELIWTFETEGPGQITAAPNFAGDLT